MQRKTTRRWFLSTGASIGAVGLTGCLGDDDDDQPPTDDEPDDEPPADDDPDDEPPADDDPDDEPDYEPTYEIWGLDQGTDTGYIYVASDPEEPSFELVDTIDFTAFSETVDSGVVPHMIDFSSDFEYAAVACTAGAQTLVIRTEDRELVAAVDTGPGSHFAGFGPNDEFIQVDVIGEGSIVRIDADLANETFEIVDSIEISSDPAIEDRSDEFEGTNPICHQYSPDGFSYHTLGPGIDDAGLVIVDTESFEINSVYSPDEIRTNCGTVHHPSDSKMYLTAGAPSNHASGGVGDWYVFDTETHRPIDQNGDVIPEGESVEYETIARDTGGFDAHGFWFTPDGSELWVVNRETHNGLVIDPSTDEVIDEVESFGSAPDILSASPDGDFIIASLRGGEPVSGDPHAATGETPGFSAIDITSREVVAVVQPDGDNEESDFHGIGVRYL